MFALGCYADDKGIGTKSSFGTYHTMHYFNENAKLIGYVDSSEGPDAFFNQKMDWVSMCEKMMMNYFEAGVLKQYKDGMILQNLFSKITDKISGVQKGQNGQEISDAKLKCAKEVMEAWEKTERDTGIDPMPMNKLSTSMSYWVENGKQGNSNSFLGDSIQSAKEAVEAIINRINDPALSSQRDKSFAEQEMTFYTELLKNFQ